MLHIFPNYFPSLHNSKHNGTLVFCICLLIRLTMWKFKHCGLLAKSRRCQKGKNWKWFCRIEPWIFFPTPTFSQRISQTAVIIDKNTNLIAALITQRSVGENRSIFELNFNQNISRAEIFLFCFLFSCPSMTSLVRNFCFRCVTFI